MPSIRSVDRVRPVTTHKSGLNGAVAAELRGEMSAQRLTQTDLSARSGVPVVSIQRYLAATRPIDVEVLDRLAHALGTSAHEVMLAAAQRLARMGEEGSPEL